MMRTCSLVLVAMLAVVAQPVAALNMQLQLQLTKGVARTRQNDAYLSIAASSFLAIKDFNERQSAVIPLGASCDTTTQIAVEIVDSTGNEKVALNSILVKTQANQPDIIVGPLTSGEVVPMALTASVLEIPIIAYAATSQKLDDSTQYSTFMRTVPSDGTVAGACCKMFSVYEYKYVSVLYADDAYGSAYKDALTESCASLGIQTRAVSFKVFSPDSVRNAVKTLRSFEGNIVVAIVYGSDVKTAVRQAYEIDMIGPSKLWVFTDAADSATLQDVATAPELAKALDGNLRVFPKGTVRGHGRFAEFSTRWKAVGGSDSAALADRAYINDLLNSSAALNPVDASFFQGDDGSIWTFGAYIYDAIVSAGSAACEGGMGDLRTAMKSRSPPLEGVSGPIEFGENGSRDPRSAYFAVENLLWDGDALSLLAVGSLNATTGKLNTMAGQKVMFSGVSEVPPPDRAVVVTNYNYISETVFSAALGMVSILVLLTTSTLVWVVVHRKSRVVQHSQGLFLITLLVGTLLSSLTILPLVLDDKHVSEEMASMACMASPWLYSLGFVITFSALFAKTYRIAKIFNNKSMQRIKIKTKDLFGAVGILAVLDGTLLAAWQVSSPLQWQRGRTQIDSFNRTLETLGVCTDVPLGMTSAPSSTDSNTFLAVIACLHVGLLMYGNYLTYTARNLPTTFQESKWIALAMGSMLQLFMMGVPIVYAVANDPTARGLVMTSVIFLNNLVLIGAVMFPKLHAYYALGDGKGMKGVTSVKGTTRACSSVAPTSVAHSSAAATVVTSSHAAA